MNIKNSVLFGIGGTGVSPVPTSPDLPRLIRGVVRQAQSLLGLIQDRTPSSGPQLDFDVRTSTLCFTVIQTTIFPPPPRPPSLYAIFSVSRYFRFLVPHLSSVPLQFLFAPSPQIFFPQWDFFVILYTFLTICHIMCISAQHLYHCVRQCLLWRLSVRAARLSRGFGSSARAHLSRSSVSKAHAQQEAQPIASRPTGPLTARVLMDGGSARPRVSNRAPGKVGVASSSSSTPSLSSTSQSAVPWDCASRFTPARLSRATRPGCYSPPRPLPGVSPFQKQDVSISLTRLLSHITLNRHHSFPFLSGHTFSGKLNCPYPDGRRLSPGLYLFTYTQTLVAHVMLIRRKHWLLILRVFSYRYPLLYGNTCFSFRIQISKSETVLILAKSSKDFISRLFCQISRYRLYRTIFCRLLATMDSKLRQNLIQWNPETDRHMTCVDQSEASSE